MLELLLDGAHARVQGTLGRVLEIGSGCGYQAALLARLGSSVISIERLRPLHELARERLAPLRGQRGSGDIRLVYGDGRIGHAPNAPYHSIIAAAGGDELPPAWLEQLAVGGRLVAPLHDAADAVQRLVVVDRNESGIHRRVHEAVRFVPLKSGLA
jgi:protein-L-isoaspartate(D-aspartate) O-methyltransferase